MLNKFSWPSLVDIFSVLLITFLIYFLAEIFRPGLIVSYLNLQALLAVILFFAIMLCLFKPSPNYSRVLLWLTSFLVVFSVSGIIYLSYQGSSVVKVALYLVASILLIFLILNVQPKSLYQPLSSEKK